MRHELWKRCGVVILALALGHAVASADEPIAFVGGTLIDGNGGAPIEGAVLIVRDRLVAAVGAEGSVDVPPDARVIDTRGQTVMPGLADMHIHLLGGWDGVNVDMLGYQRYLNAMLYAGITSVLDVGNVMPYILQIRSEIAKGAIAGPRIYSVGSLVDGADPVWPPISIVMASKDQASSIVSLLNRSGVDAIKAYQGLSVPLLQALVEEASKVDLPVIADLWTRTGSYDAAATGISAFAHLPSRPLEAATIELMKEKQVAVITTLAVKETFARTRLDDFSFMDHPLVAETNPPEFTEALREHATKELNEAEQNSRERWHKSLKTSQENARKLLENGVMMVAGTDAPYPGTLYGEALHRELELLVDSGLTPLQAISTASRNAAALLKSDDWGTLEAGKRADLIVVDGRPDRSIGDTRKVRVVMQAGRIIDRDELTFDPADGPVFSPGNAVDASH